MNIIILCCHAAGLHRCEHYLAAAFQHPPHKCASCAFTHLLSNLCRGADQRGGSSKELENKEASASPVTARPQSVPLPPTQHTGAGVGQGRNQWEGNREEPARASQAACGSSPGSSPSSSPAASEGASEEASTTSHILAAYRARQQAASQVASAAQAASAHTSPSCAPPHSDPLDRKGASAAAAARIAPPELTADADVREQQGLDEELAGASTGAAGGQQSGGSQGSAPPGQDFQGDGLLGQPNPLLPAAGEEYSEDYYISGDITSEDSKF